MTPVFDSLTFDELKHLAEKHPEKLEEYRQQWIEQTIDEASSSHQRRLRGLQFQIDMQRRKSKTPMASCIQISKMMHDSLANLYEVITQEKAISVAPVEVAQNYSTSPRSTSASVTAAADNKVITFPSVATVIAAD